LLVELSGIPELLPSKCPLYWICKLSEAVLVLYKEVSVLEKSNDDYRTLYYMMDMGSFTLYS